jgi:hypothetical protein
LKTLLKKCLMKLWANGVLPDRKTEFLIHFFAVEEA